MKVLEQSDQKVTLRLLGAHVTPLSADELIETLSKKNKSPRPFIVANHNLHSIYLNLTRPDFNAFYRKADVVVIDGYPVLLATRRELKRGSGASLGPEYRIGSMDWLSRISDIDGVHRIAVVGASEESNSRAVARLTAENPGLVMKGWPGEGWTNAKAEAICVELQAYKPDLILVGLGMPLQEQFISKHMKLLPNSIVATVGGAIDQLAGSQRAAPRWLGKFGLEWLWRLATQPKRLGRRYLVEPWLLMAVIAKRQIETTRIGFSITRHSKSDC